MSEYRCHACQAVQLEPELVCPHCGASAIPNVTFATMQGLRRPTPLERFWRTLFGWLVWGAAFVVLVVAPLLYVALRFMGM
jgi:hypothetical protein